MIITKKEKIANKKVMRSFRLPKESIKLLKIKARESGRSMNEIVEIAILAAVKEGEETNNAEWDKVTKLKGVKNA